MLQNRKNEKKNEKHIIYINTTIYSRIALLFDAKLAS